MIYFCIILTEAAVVRSSIKMYDPIFLKNVRIGRLAYSFSQILKKLKVLAKSFKNTGKGIPF